MAALTAARKTDSRVVEWAGITEEVGADSTQFYKGGIVCLDQADGKVKKGSVDTGLVCLGRSLVTLLTGTSNTKRIPAESGIFKWLNSAAGDAIAADDVGKDCFIVDDQTVALTDGTGTRSKAGVVYGVDSDGVWVATGFPL